MSATAAPTRASEATLGIINFVAPDIASSLFRNGAMLIRRNVDGSDSGFEGVVLEKREQRIRDARILEGSQRRTLTRNGFELLTAPLERPNLDFLSHREVVHEYYGECVRLVQGATGAAHVFAFDHNIRSAGGKQRGQRIHGGQEVQAPGHLAHGDYTLTSGPDRLRQLACPPSVNDTYRALLEPGQPLIPEPLANRALDRDGRFAIINVWRNISDQPVASHPLGLCDAQSVRPEDLVVFEIHYQDRVGENYFSKHSPRHEWFYYPAMTRDEALLIKQWDSAGPLARSEGRESDGDDARAPCSFSFHSAFEDPALVANAPDRWSIEVRCLAIYK